MSAPRKTAQARPHETQEALTRGARTERDPRWARVRERDREADGTFFYSVKTTGVYCRPSCAARLARPENVAFHASITEAKNAGFRPCKRCKPDLAPQATRQAAQIAELCRYIESCEEPPSLRQLAERAGISAYHLHRLFKAVTGVTPKSYASANRAARMREELVTQDTVTRAIYSAGYNSAARFYESSSQWLGMTPKKYRSGGADLPVRFAVRPCSLGLILAATTERGLCAILLGDTHDELARDLAVRFPRAQLMAADSDFDGLLAEVVALVDNPGTPTTLPLDIRGTAFQQRVWKALASIPAGTTYSYAQVAEAIGKPTAVRAVARACAANSLAVAIPCHRVVRGDGSPSGYRWGMERKQRLLASEAAESTATRRRTVPHDKQKI